VCVCGCVCVCVKNGFRVSLMEIILDVKLLGFGHTYPEFFFDVDIKAYLTLGIGVSYIYIQGYE